MSIQKICGDCVVVMRNSLPNNCVQLTVTSPPYDNLRSYNGHCRWDFQILAKEIYRATCIGGVVCWNCGDATIKGSETMSSFKQAIFFVEQCGFNLHDTMIWNKPNFSNPSSNRYHQLFEYVFVLSKGRPKTFNPIKDKPNKYPHGPWGKNTFRTPDGEMKERKFKPAAPFGMRGNVWSGNTTGQENGCRSLPHPAMMPKWLAQDLILSWSNPGDMVLDPMCGSGTTCKEAEKLGRNSIGIDTNEEYMNLF